MWNDVAGEDSPLVSGAGRLLQGDVGGRLPVGDVVDGDGGQEVDVQGDSQRAVHRGRPYPHRQLRRLTCVRRRSYVHTVHVSITLSPTQPHCARQHHSRSNKTVLCTSALLSVPHNRTVHVNIISSVPHFLP